MASNDFDDFKKKMSGRKGSCTASNVYEQHGKGRRRSSVMIEYFRDNYMGTEVKQQQQQHAHVICSL